MKPKQNKLRKEHKKLRFVPTKEEEERSRRTVARIIREGPVDFHPEFTKVSYERALQKVSTPIDEKFESQSSEEELET